MPRHRLKLMIAVLGAANFPKQPSKRKNHLKKFQCMVVKSKYVYVCMYVYIYIYIYICI